MRIAIIGTGYVGLVTGTCLAETGNQVCCIDNNNSKVARLKKGQVPIYEPGLQTIFERNWKKGTLVFTSDLKEGIEGAELIFLALPTPPGDDGSTDLSYVLKVADDIGKIITGYTIVVGKSTVPAGTAEKVYAAISRNYSGKFDVVSNPEFLREGLAVEDFMKPDRIIIGTTSDHALKVMTELYAPFVRQGNPIICMDERSAELTKYAANAFLATKISFMNEIAQMCEEVGADVDMVRHGMGTDERIGKRFLFPGIGYGGSCFPKDVRSLLFEARKANFDFKILEAVTEVNIRQRFSIVSKILRYFNDIQGKHFAVWGLSFKPNTDDIREAPALDIIEALLDRGATVSAYDPEAMHNVEKVMGDRIHLAPTPYYCLENADALIITTEWNEFRTPDFDTIISLMNEPVIFDGRNLFDLRAMEEKGFYYESIGRSLINQLNVVI
jgi:UDPglucose 6-dehydrogenase